VAYDICPGEGPAPARVMFVTEHPGTEEMLQGRPAVGRTSSEFSRYLDGYLLPCREEVYITNLIKTLPAGKGISDDEIARDEHLLADELWSVQPQIVVTLGRASSRHFLGDVDLETVHGIPHPSRITDTFSSPPPIVFPCYHYAAGLHAPELAAKYDYDMQRLSLLLKGKLPAKPQDTLVPYYSETPEACIVSPVVGVDTEGWVTNPWCISYSEKPGSGFVVRPSGRFGVSSDTLVVLHNSLHDLTVLRAMGVMPRKYTDTMIMAYLLGLEPQGLKPLAYRHAGMLQDDYADLTREAGERIAREWLEKVLTDFNYMRSPGPKPPDLEKTFRLVERMLKKEDGARGLRERWADCRAREVLEDEMELVGAMPEPTLDDVPLEKAIHYAARDADATLRIYPVLDQQIDAMGLRDALDADLGALPMIDRMQTVGLKVDLDYFHDLSPFFQTEWDNYQQKLDAFAGRHLNVNSGDQVAEYLFDQLRLTPGKKTKGGRPSTNDKILEGLRKDPRTSEKGQHAIDLIQEVREIRKLKSAFCDKMPGYVRSDGRIHPNFRVTRVATGRLAASDPNLLAFPKHSHRGKLIRAGFIADTGHNLGEWDLDQIEMRVMAIDADDDVMIAEFLSGIDKHTATASMIFGKKPEDVDKEIERFAAKAVNFGILMGITEHGLLDQFKKNGSYKGMTTRYNRITEEDEKVRIEWDLDECKGLLKEWHRIYPKSSRYMSDKHAEARRYGYVRDLFGRLRYIPGVRSYDKFVRAAAERDAQSTPIQSGAQGIVKRWMKAVWDRLPALQAQGVYVEPLLQIHDALILEFDTEHYAKVNALVLGALDELQWFPISVSAKGKSGERWSDL